MFFEIVFYNLHVNRIVCQHMPCILLILKYPCFMKGYFLLLNHLLIFRIVFDYLTAINQYVSHKLEHGKIHWHSEVCFAFESVFHYFNNVFMSEKVIYYYIMCSDTQNHFCNFWIIFQNLRHNCIAYVDIDCHMIFVRFFWCIFSSCFLLYLWYVFTETNNRNNNRRSIKVFLLTLVTLMIAILKDVKSTKDVKISRLNFQRWKKSLNSSIRPVMTDSSPPICNVINEQIKFLRISQWNISKCFSL